METKEIKLFKKNGELVSYNVGKPMARGSHAKVYRIGKDRCLKKFNIFPFKYDMEMFDIFLESDLANFYKIYELLYNRKIRLDAYDMKFYKEDVFNIIDIPTDYILDNFSSILMSINILSRKGIQVRDLIPINLIFSKDGITVIDVDSYRRLKDCDKDELAAKNELALVKVLQELMLANLIGYYSDDENIGKYLRANDGLFRTNKFSDISKKLVRCKTPMDYYRGRNC